MQYYSICNRSINENSLNSTSNDCKADNISTITQQTYADSPASASLAYLSRTDIETEWQTIVRLAHSTSPLLLGFLLNLWQFVRLRIAAAMYVYKLRWVHLRNDNRLAISFVPADPPVQLAAW